MPPKKDRTLDDYNAHWQGMQNYFPLRNGVALGKLDSQRAHEIAKHKTCYPEILTWTRRCIDTGCMHEGDWPRENQVEWTSQFVRDFWSEGYRVIFNHTFGDFIRKGLSPEFITMMCHKLGKHPDIDALMCFQNVMVQIRYWHTLCSRNILTSRREYHFTDDYLPFFSDDGFFPLYPAYDLALPDTAQHLPVSWHGERDTVKLVMVSRTPSGTSFAVNVVGG